MTDANVIDMREKQEDKNNLKHAKLVEIAILQSAYNKLQGYKTPETKAVLDAIMRSQAKLFEDAYALGYQPPNQSIQEKTREGRTVKVVSIDTAFRYPVVARTLSENVITLTLDGKHDKCGIESPLDIVEEVRE